MSSDSQSIIEAAQEAVREEQNRLNRLSHFLEPVGIAIANLVKAKSYTDEATGEEIENMIHELEALVAGGSKTQGNKVKIQFHLKVNPKPDEATPEGDKPESVVRVIAKKNRTAPAAPKKAEAPKPVAWGLTEKDGEGAVQLTGAGAVPQLPSSKAAEAEAQAAAPSVNVQIAEAPTAPKPKRLKRFEPFAPMQRIVTTVLGMKRFPKTFEEVLEASFGPEWKDRTYHTVQGRGMVTEIPFGEEIYKPNSQIRAQLRKALENIYGYWKEEYVPEGYEATEVMRRFAEMAANRKITFESLNVHLKRWGI